VTRIAVLEIGGTHASSAWVESESWTVEPAGRCSLPGEAGADELVDALAATVSALGPVGDAVLSVAVPGPFDYERGIGRFRDVGKFDALDGVDVGRALSARLPDAPARITFVNDAAAFGLGEWRAGAARGSARAVAITLGTGVGSAFVADGRVIDSGPDVPPDGYAYRLEWAGRPLEWVVSRRAIIARYRAAGGDRDGDVADIARRAAGGDLLARAAFVQPLQLLGRALAPWLIRFRAEVLVVGGGISRSWPLVADALRTGLGADGLTLPVRRSADPERSAQVGAAWHAVGEIGTLGVPAAQRDET